MDPMEERSGRYVVVVDECRYCGQEVFQVGSGDWMHYQDGNRFCGKFPNTTPARPRRGGERAVARTTDPITSHAAAASVRAITAKQGAVLRLLEQIGPATDEEVFTEYMARWTAGQTDLFPKQSESGLRTRRSELVKKGKVVPSGRYKVKPTGRKAIVWRLVDPSA